MACGLSLLIVVLLCGVGVVTAQRPNCAGLDIRNALNNTSPFAGGNLPFCRNPSLQCCTAQYFMNRRMQLRDSELLQALRDELSDNLDVFMNLRNAFDNYIDNNFIGQFINEIPGLRRVPANLSSGFVNNFKRRLADNFRINDTISPQNRFNLTSFFEEEYQELWELLVNTISATLKTNFNMTQRACIITQLRGIVNETNRARILNSIQELRRVSTALFRIYRWYRFTFLPSLSNYRPINQCVNRFITLRCAACTRNIPQLCRGVCSALIRGCFSPFQIGLRAQFNILWNVTRQIVRRGTNILQALGPIERRSVIVDLTSDFALLQFYVQLRSSCGGLPPPPIFGGRRRRQTNNEMDFRPPSTVMGNATRLAGVFSYSMEGPRFCRSNPTANCWNGRSTVARGDVSFDDDDISDQDENPVEPFNVTALNEQAVELGTPVSNFLRSTTFTEVVPEEVSVPPGEPYTPTDDRGSASMLKTAPLLLLFLASLVLALF